MRLIHRLRAISSGDRGATSIEYALMVTLIAIVIIAAVIVLGTSLSSIFNDAGTKIANP